MSETTSLRPVIADILEGIGMRRYLDQGSGVFAGLRLFAGADALRWAHEFDEAPDEFERAELEYLRELVGDIECWLGETNRAGKPVHPGVFRKRVAERLKVES